ncbi:MAG: head GIN domain-containing protein, partial [Candidatus Arcticimaribacter sp.]
MKHLTYTLSAFILFISLNACAQNKRKGNGKLVTKERSVEKFDALKVAGSFNVELTSSMENQISIYTDENLIEDIITEVKKGVLIIRTKKNSYFKTSNRKSVKIKVPLVALKEASLSGSGKIHSENTINTADFKASLSGSGKIVLAVEAKETSAQLSGSGKISLKGKA